MKPKPKMKQSANLLRAVANDLRRALMRLIKTYFDAYHFQ